MGLTGEGSGGLASPAAGVAHEPNDDAKLIGPLALTPPLSSVSTGREKSILGPVVSARSQPGRTGVVAAEAAATLAATDDWEPAAGESECAYPWGLWQLAAVLPGNTIPRLLRLRDRCRRRERRGRRRVVRSRAVPGRSKGV